MTNRARIDGLRTGMEELERELGAERVRQWRDGSGASRIATILASRRSLGADAFRIVEDALGGAAGDGTPGSRDRGLLRLAAATARVAEEQASAEHLDRAGSLLGTPREVPGAGVLTPVRALDRAAAEPDRTRREVLAAAWDEASAAARPHLERGLGRAWDASSRLGPESYVEAWSGRTGIDHAALAAGARHLLHATADLARDAVRELVSRRIGVKSPRWHDVLHAATPGPIPDAIPAGHAPVAFKLFLGAIGIDAAAGGRLRMVDAPEAGPDAGAIALSVPQDVRVPARRGWGLPGLRRSLRDLGAALHVAHVDAGLAFDDRGLMDPALPASTGALFEHLAATPPWLARVAKVLAPRDAARIPALLALLEARRDAAGLVGQLELAGSLEMAGARDLGEALAAQAMTFPCAGAALDALAPRLSAATPLRATALALLHAGALRDRFDEDWFRNPRAGAHLLALWRMGGTLDVSAVIPGPPDLHALPAIFESMLS